MKNAVIFCFSGTGNTDRIMDVLVRALRDGGVQTVCYSMEDCLRAGVVPDLSACDAVGIGYPVYAFNVPSVVARFIRMMPRVEGNRPLFVFKTSGEPFPLNRASSFYIRARLRKKGYDLNYERDFLMPYNIMFRYRDEVVKQITLLSQKLARKMAEELSHGVINKPRFNPLSVFVSLLFRIQWPGAALNGRLMSVGDACIRCGKCVRECKTGNIHLENGKIRFGWKCTMCMRCVMYCPQKAVRAGLLERWAVRGTYDFDRILADEAISPDYIGCCRELPFRYFKKYIAKAEDLTKDIPDI